MNPSKTSLVFRLTRIAALSASALFSLLAIYEWLGNLRQAIQQPLLILPYPDVWTPALLEAALTEMGLHLGFYSAYALVISLLFNLAFLVCGWLILRNKRDTWFGLYLGLILILWANGAWAFIKLPPHASQLAGLSPYLSWIEWPGLFLITYFFPSGHIVPRWARAFAGILIGLIVYGVVITAFEIEVFSFQIGVPLIILCLLVGGYSQVYRFRHSEPVERQQVKWVVLALLNFIAIFITMTLLVNLSGVYDPKASDPPTALVASMGTVAATALAYIALPVSIALAMLRYRLWDVDVVVRKTLQYTLLTGVLAIVYFGSVVLLQNIFGQLTGERNSPLITVISTLGIAALFSRLRRRIQEFINRRFYRSNYNAEQALARFSTTARDEVNMDVLTASMLTVVGQTIHPDQASLWVRVEWRKP